MLKIGDEVMFWFIIDGLIFVGRGKVNDVKDHVIIIFWSEMERMVNITNEGDVYPFDDDKYYKMKDETSYNSALKEISINEITRLRDVCIGD